MLKEITPELYMQIPLHIEAIQVTRDNMRLVAKWCGGVIHSDRQAKQFIKVNVHKPMSNKQTMAYVGCWVTKSKNGWKVYTDTAWRKGFTPVPQESDPKALELLEEIFTADVEQRRRDVIEVEEAVLHGKQRYSEFSDEPKVRGGWMQKVIDDVRPKMRGVINEVLAEELNG